MIDFRSIDDAFFHGKDEMDVEAKK